MKKKLIKYLLSIIIALLLIFLINPFYQSYKLKEKYNFKVQSQNAKLSLDSFKGKVLVVYFGYMSCPDVCPTSLHYLSQVLQTFPKKDQDDFRGLFISLDPTRDTLKNLVSYTKYFNPHFLGATTNTKDINKIVKRYGAHYEKVYLKNSALGYSIAHTSYFYIFNKKGKFIAQINHFVQPKKLRKILVKLFKE